MTVNTIHRVCIFRRRPPRFVGAHVAGHLLSPREREREGGREVEEVVAMQRFVYAPRPATRVCTHGVEGAAARGISGG